MSFGAIFENELIPCMDRVYGRAISLVKDPLAAEDLLQETYLKAWRSIESYEAGTQPSAWLNRILYRLFIDQYRRKKAGAEEVSLDAHSLDLESGPARDAGPNLGKSLESWGGDEVVEALYALPETARVVVIMIDVDAFSYEETADLLDIPVGTVRSRLFRARQALHRKLYDYARKNGLVTETMDIQP